jgi:hypothetical protein
VQVVGDGVVRLSSQDEVGGDELGALVDKLEEGVLGVGARLTEQDGAWMKLLVKSSKGLMQESSSFFQRRNYIPVVYLADEPSEVMLLPLDSIDSCWR